jgi:putative heme-binding domain-containing protein
LAALTNRDPLWLLTAVLDPNREVDARYLSWTALDRNGRRVTGLLAEESSTSIRLQLPDGKQEVLLRSDLARLQCSDQSMMPAGIERDLTPQDLADVVAYVLRLDSPPKTFAGNRPQLVAANRKGELRLGAAVSEIRGGDILFEQPFGNIGYWHGAGDRATWRIDVARGGPFDVYLDFACADPSAGNRFRIDGLGETLRGQVPATGGWDQYRQHRIGQVKLERGPLRVTVRADGPLQQSALFDLREVRLVPAGQTTQFSP